MNWLLIAFLVPILQSILDAFIKKSVHQVDKYVVAWAFSFFGMLTMLPLLISQGIPEIGKPFWIAFLISGIINIVTVILYMKALEKSDLSVTIPMVTFTPVFLLVTSPLLVGEFPPLIGIVGVVLIVTGSYLLNLTKKKEGIFTPFKALLKQPGPRLMLLTAFLWSISTNFDKIGVQNSSSFFWTFMIFLVMSVGTTPFMLRKVKKVHAKQFALLAPLGVVAGVTGALQLTVINYLLVVYVISIKRLNALLGVVFGWLFFKEKGIKERFLGAVVMVLGVFCIALA
jgi:uncharacterized membrane protein